MTGETRVEAYRRFLEVLGVKPHEEAPAHRIAFNVAWHAAIDYAVAVEDAVDRIAGANS